MKISEINATDGFTSQKDTRLHGHWLAVAWVGWSILTLLSLIDFMSSIHEYLVDVQVLCRPGSCLEGQPTQESAQVLHLLRLSVTAYAALGVGLVIISALVCCAVAAVIVWRKPRDWMALLVSITLITQGLYEDNYLPSIFDNPSSPWNIVGLMLGYLAPVLVLFSVAFFPNGRPVPRWIGWLLAVICLIDLPPSLFPSMLYGGLIETLFVLSGFPLIVGSLIYRYRRVSTPLERQQIKWVVFGITLAMVAFMGWFIPQIFLFSSLSPHGSVYDLFGHPLLVLSELSIPLCIGFAVLRYHLWDIDVIINKALEDAGIRAYVPLPDWEERYEVWPASHFRYEAQADQYRCPQGQVLQRVGVVNADGRQLYRAPASICNDCPVKVQCTTSTQGRRVYRHVGEEYLERVRTYQQTLAYQKALRKRQVWVEPLFAEAKDWHGLRRFRLRLLWRVNCEALRIATGQNLKRLLKKRGWGRRPFPVEALCASFWGLLCEVLVLILEKGWFLVPIG